jgi:chemotaxis protein methyltransferase CheR
MAAAHETGELTSKDFAWVSDTVKRLCGINLHHGKVELVRARLAKRVRQLGMQSYSAYIDHVCGDSSGDELKGMLDLLSTNQTSFFREPQHFDYLARHVVPSAPSPKLRIWSAGCSSGEEPYSIGMTLLESLPEHGPRDVMILGTDLSRRCVERARFGWYPRDKSQSVPPTLLTKYFTKATHEGKDGHRVAPVLHGLVHLARLNFLDPWPMKGPFDAIFCRNVMIYFDRDVQRALVARFASLLRPGGTFFTGAAESLMRFDGWLRYVRPTIYERLG